MSNAIKFVLLCIFSLYIIGDCVRLYIKELTQ